MAIRVILIRVCGSYSVADPMFTRKSSQNMSPDTLQMLDPARYNVAGALEMYADHKAGKANHTRELRTLLMSATWIRSMAG